MPLNAFDKTSFNNLLPNLEPKQTADSEKLQAALQDMVNQFDAIRNTLIGTAAGDSGAHNIGSDAISGVTGATVYAQLANLKAQIDQVVSQGVADGSITQPKLAQALIDYLRNAVTFQSKQLSDFALLASAIAVRPSQYQNPGEMYLGQFHGDNSSSATTYTKLGTVTITKVKGLQKFQITTSIGVMSTPATAYVMCQINGVQKFEHTQNSTTYATFTDNIDLTAYADGTVLTVDLYYKTTDGTRPVNYKASNLYSNAYYSLI